MEQQEYLVPKHRPWGQRPSAAFGITRHERMVPCKCFLTAGNVIVYTAAARGSEKLSQNESEKPAASNEMLG